MALLEGFLDAQSLPLGTAIAVGGPAVALGGLWLFKAYVNDQRKRRSANLPPVPGTFSFYAVLEIICTKNL